MLDEWIRKYFKPVDWSEWDEAITSLKEVRRLRQEPAHVIKQNNPRAKILIFISFPLECVYLILYQTKWSFNRFLNIPKFF